MDLSRCPDCKRRLMAMTDRTGRTNMVCLKCDNIDPMKTDAAKWAASSLATYTREPVGQLIRPFPDIEEDL